MSVATELTGTKLPAEVQGAVTVFCEEVRAALGASLVSVSLYGSAVRDDFRPGKSDVNLLVVVERVDVATLKKLLDPTIKGRRHGLAPFVLTQEDLRTSTDVFSVKFICMKEAHRTLFGPDVLEGLQIGREHLRLQCEQSMKNLLLRLRKQYLSGGGRGLTMAMSNTVGGLCETLRIALSLAGQPTVPRPEVETAAARTFEFNGETLRKVLALRHLDVALPHEQSEPLFGEYMALVDHVAGRIDRMPCG